MKYLQLLIWKLFDEVKVFDGFVKNVILIIKFVSF